MGIVRTGGLDDIGGDLRHGRDVQDRDDAHRHDDPLLTELVRLTESVHQVVDQVYVYVHDELSDGNPESHLDGPPRRRSSAKTTG